LISQAGFLKGYSQYLPHVSVRVLYQLNISRFTLIGRSYVETRLEGSGQMGLIDKACRLRDVGERRDTFSQHRYSSLYSVLELYVTRPWDGPAVE